MSTTLNSFSVSIELGLPHFSSKGLMRGLEGQILEETSKYSDLLGL